MKQLDSPFIIKMLSAYEDAFHLYLLLEFARGGELFALTSKFKKYRVPFEQSRFYAACIAAALEHMHGLGILYRDLKMENLLIDKDGYLKVCDFGLSKIIGKEGRTYSECGTACYNAPEMVNPKSTGGYGFASDVWALGIVTFELFVGRVPFDAEESEEVIKMARDKLTGDGDSYIAQRMPDSVNAEPGSGVAIEFLQKLIRLDAEVRPVSPSSHPFLAVLDPGALQAQILDAPYVPSLETEVDVSGFSPPESSEILKLEDEFNKYWELKLQTDKTFDGAFAKWSYKAGQSPSPVRKRQATQEDLNDLQALDERVSSTITDLRAKTDRAAQRRKELIAALTIADFTIKLRRSSEVRDDRPPLPPQPQASRSSFGQGAEGPRWSYSDTGLNTLTEA